eukprot:gene7335-8541_t
MEYPYGKSVKFQRLAPSATLFSAFETLSKSGVNRIAVVDADDEILDIVTQFDLIHWLHENLDKMGSKRTESIKNIGASNQYVMSVLKEEQVIDALKLIKIMAVGGVAVINDDGILVGNLSGRDIKKIGKKGEHWKLLFSPVIDFVDREPIVCTDNDTIEDVIKIFVSKNVHRVYIVDDDFKTMGVITLRDIIREILPLTSTITVPLFESDLFSGSIPFNPPVTTQPSTGDTVAKPTSLVTKPLTEGVSASTTASKTGGATQ